MLRAASAVLIVLLMMILTGHYQLALIVGFPTLMVLREYEKEGLLR